MMFRRAFTMVELMVTIVLSMIFLNFTFSFLSNFVSEIRYLYIKEQLAIKAFRLSQIHSRGFRDGGVYVSGVVSLDSKIGDKKFRANDTKEIEIVSDNGYTKIDNYSYKELITNDSFVISNEISNDLYSISFDASIKNLEVDSIIGDANISYQKLIYTR